MIALHAFNRYILLIAGYGGHAGYAYAVGYSLVKRGFKNNVFLVAEGYDFLAEKFKPLGKVFFQVLPRKPAEPLYKGLHRWFKAMLQSTELSRRFDVAAVFAAGSNFSIPPSIVFKTLKRASTYTLEAIEHFTKPSKAVKLLEKMYSTVFLHWEEQQDMYPGGIVVGPVYEPPLYEPRDEGYVLVTTGTLGYKDLFDAIEQLGLNRVVLQTGDVDPEPYAKRNPSWITFRYTSDIHRWVAGASLVITQQGLTAAIAALGYRKPVIIVWNPRVVLGAPKHDVKLYAEKIGAVFLEKPNLQLLKQAIELPERPKKTYCSGSDTIARILIEAANKT